ncbi:MAG: hypothetical protein JWP74_237 [Marmoricola sp.]|nr:hypothetical protein [Marmoricola sp.]
MHVVDGVEMVDVLEAARIASRSPETIRRWVWSGRVQAVKYGTKLLIPRSAITPAQPVEHGSGLTLAQWAAEISTRAAGKKPSPGLTAAELLLAEREERSSGAGS